MSSKINWKDHTGLVHMVANKFKGSCGSCISYEDLTQAGLMGLLKAVDKYDAARGTFSTCAVLWITDAIRKEIAKNARVVNVPRHELQRAAKAGTPYSLRTESEPAAAPNLDGELDMGDELDRKKLYLAASKVIMQHLSPRQQQVLRLLHGKGKTQAEVAEVMGLSAEGVRYIEKQAIAIVKEKISQ